MTVGAIEKDCSNVNNNDLVLKYQDDEDDWISLKSEQEWREALNIQMNLLQRGQNQLLRVQVSLRNPAKVHISVIHEGVECDKCHTQNIQGIRYQCKDCSDYDLCERCYSRRHTFHDMDHHFTAINVPTETRRQMYMKPRYNPYGGHHSDNSRRRSHPSLVRTHSPQSPPLHPVFAEMKRREEELSTRAPPNYETEFEHLASMGFDNKPLNAYLLQQYNGDLTRTVSTLLDINGEQNNKQILSTPAQPADTQMSLDSSQNVTAVEDTEQYDTPRL